MSVSRVVIHLLSTVQIILGLAIAAASVWFYIQIYGLTSLRNTNHYLLDYNVYWPQAVPWMFIIVGLFVIGAASCGFASANRKSRGLIAVYIVVLSIVIVGLAASAAVALIFANNKSSEDFVKDTVLDVYDYSKTNAEVATSFGLIERKLQCCGANGPRDYKNWKPEFPISCCNEHPQACDFSNKHANERQGCSIVLVYYSRIVVYALSAGAIVTAIFSICAIASAGTLFAKLKKRKLPSPQSESEIKKVLL